MSRPDAGRVAVVTGGTGALGRAVVAALLEAGCRVHVPWIAEREPGALEAHVGALTDGLRLRRADVADSAQVERFFAEVAEQDGRLDVLCNLAGGFRMAPVEATAPADWAHLMGMNATSAFLCCRSAVPMMREGGGGRIVNVAALPAVDRGAGGMAAYAASKAAVLSLTYSLAKELRSARIAVNAVAPETLDTPANRQGMPDADRTRWVAPEEAARVIAFLAGADAEVVTGSVLVLARG